MHFRLYNLSFCTEYYKSNLNKPHISRVMPVLVQYRKWINLKSHKLNAILIYRKFIFSQMVAAFSMLSSWLGVSRKAPLVRKSLSLISESVSWSCQSPDARRPSWFNRNRELLFDVDMSFSHVALPSCPLWDIFYTMPRWDRLNRT